MWTTQFTSASVIIHEQIKAYEGFNQVVVYKLAYPRFQGGMNPIVTREVILKRHAAAALLVDLKQDKVMLLEQFRIGMLNHDHPWMLEVVAGLIDPGENALSTIKREIVEEAGLIPLELFPVLEYYNSPGTLSEKVQLFVALVDAHPEVTYHGLEEEAEDIKVIPFGRAEAMTLLQEGKIVNATTVIALQWLALHHDALKAGKRDF